MRSRTEQVLSKLRRLRRRFRRGTESFDVDAFLENARGGITVAEGKALMRHAAAAPSGCAVEVGSHQGKSAVALAHGLGGRPLYCIEPHESFIGVRGGQFGPEDRAAFYRTMLETSAYGNTRLVNLTSREAVAGWRRPIGALFIDGDHRHPAVKEDFESWSAHVVAGGLIALDDTHRSELGPARLLRELLPSREFEELERVGKITFVRKLGPYVLPVRSRLDILVVCHRLEAAGGLRRFERLARALPKDRLAFVRLASAPLAERASELEVLTPEQASAVRWDVTMVPGQAFPQETIERLSDFVDPRFGQRIQHVLNDAHRKEGFVAVNRSFRPHGVVFNNRHWQAEDITDFMGDRFSVLEGAVDVQGLAPADQEESSEPGARRIGGIDRPRLRDFWRALLPLLPAGWKLMLMGPPPNEPIPDVEYVGELTDDELPAFYRRADLVFSPEVHAGWANVVAEAMAAEVPVVCTEAGTLPLARHSDTALVLSAESVEPWIDALDQLQRDPEGKRAMTARARERVSAFDWKSYARTMRSFVQDDGRHHYTMAPELGLLGKWPAHDRLHGLETLLNDLEGCSVLDLGCAEGLAARACFEHGAHAVHGFERDASRVAAALRLNPQPLALFRAASVSPWSDFEQQAHLRPAYDAVLHLGLHHHLPRMERQGVLRGALARCRRWFAIRTPASAWEADDVDAIVRAQGFELVGHRTPELRTEGRLGLYRRTIDEPRLSRRNLRFVSFPKSGRTWLRYALTQLGLADAIRFDHDGFEYNDGAQPPLDFDEAKRWRACHRADRVVYLDRDPREVMVSLYHQVTGRFRDFFHYQGDISDFIRHPYFGAENLAGFQRMWNRVAAEGLAVSVSYADAHRDFEGTLRKVVDAFGLQASDLEIRQASQGSRFENMKRVEAQGDFDKPWLRMRNQAPKVRRGEQGSYRSELSIADQDYLNEVFADLLGGRHEGLGGGGRR